MYFTKLYFCKKKIINYLFTSNLSLKILVIPLNINGVSDLSVNRINLFGS